MIMNWLGSIDDYGRSTTTRLLWHKDTRTAGESSAKYFTGAELMPKARVGNAADGFDAAANARSTIYGALPLSLESTS